MDKDMEQINRAADKAESWVLDTLMWTLAGAAALLSMLLTAYMVLVMKTELVEGPILNFGQPDTHVAQKAAERESLDPAHEKCCAGHVQRCLS
jgi:hypothetical protein